MAGSALRAPAPYKRDQVDEALRRIGGLDGFELEEIEPAVEQWRYRNKLEYSFGERDGEPILGFHARGRWDLIVDVEDCLLASERRQRGTQRGARVGPAGGSPRLRRRASGPASCATSSSARAGAPGRSRPGWSPPPARFPKPPVDLHTVVEGDSGGTDGPTGVLGEERLREELCGLRLEMSTAPSSRPTPRWPSGSTRSPPSTPA